MSSELLSQIRWTKSKIIRLYELAQYKQQLVNYRSTLFKIPTSAYAPMIRVLLKVIGIPLLGFLLLMPFGIHDNPALWGLYTVLLIAVGVPYVVKNWGDISSAFTLMQVPTDVKALADVDSQLMRLELDFPRELHELETRTIVPEKYRDIRVLNVLEGYVLEGRASTWKECINLLHEETYRQTQLEELQRIKILQVLTRDKK